MTPSGKQQLEKELKKLLQVERPAAIAAIEEARSHGDLSENAEYHAAKERQAFLEFRISEIQTKIATAEVVDPKNLKLDRIAFGATVVLEDETMGVEKTFQIVGMDEADIKQGKLSYQSPLARLLVGKVEGDSVEQQTPKGDKVWVVKKVVYK